MSTTPNCFLTTSNNPKNKQTLVLVDELSKIIPNCSTTEENCKYQVKIIEQRDRPFSIVISNENDSIDLQIMEYKSLKQLRNKADPYSHLYPELIFNGFSSDIGNFLFELIVGIFPVDIEKMGNRAISFCAKNDFILLRLYRYAFRDSEKVDLQDVGPHLTLRIRKIIKNGEVEMINYKKYEYDGENYVL